MNSMYKFTSKKIQMEVLFTFKATHPKWSFAKGR